MDYNILTQSPVFCGLNEDEVKKVLQLTPHQVKKYPANSIIVSSGEVVNNLMIVMIGKVKGEMIDYSGRIIKIEDIPAAGVLASAFMFGKRNRFPVNIISLLDTEILIIGKNDFLKLLKGNSSILNNFLNLISNRSQFLSEKIRFLNFKTIKGKLAEYILQLAGSQKIIIRLDRTQNDLADFFGVARPSIARVISEMEKDGYFEANGKNIKILDRNGLADLTID